MKVTVVRYRRLQSHAVGYGHDAVEAEAELEPGESADEALERLRTWVLGRLDVEQRVRDGYRNLDQLTWGVDRLKREAQSLEENIKRGRAVLREHEQIAELARKHGLGEQADLLDPDSIPF